MTLPVAASMMPISAMAVMIRIAQIGLCSLGWTQETNSGISRSNDQAKMIRLQ